MTLPGVVGYLQVRCDLGTDCSDCGPHTYYLHRKPGSNGAPMPPKPIALLVKRNVQVCHPCSGTHRALAVLTPSVMVCYSLVGTAPWWWIQ